MTLSIRNSRGALYVFGRSINLLLLLFILGSATTVAQLNKPLVRIAVQGDTSVLSDFGKILLRDLQNSGLDAKYALSGDSQDCEFRVFVIHDTDNPRETGVVILNWLGEFHGSILRSGRTQNISINEAATAAAKRILTLWNSREYQSYREGAIGPRS